MRKKYLSALLFGALLVTSAGTFTSCKDYDDEINNLQEQIDVIKADLASLTETVKNLDGVKDMSFTDGKLYIETGKGKKVEVNIPSATGVTEVKLEGNVLYVDGKEAGKVEIPEDKDVKVEVKEDGKLYINDVAQDLEIGSKVVMVDNGDYYTMTIDGKESYNLPKYSPAALISSLSIKEEITFQSPKANTGINYNFLGTATEDMKNWKGPKGAVANNQLMIGTIAVQEKALKVAPESVDMSSLKLTLVDSKGNEAPVTVKAVSNDKLLVNDSRATSNGVWDLVLTINNSVNKDNIATSFDSNEDGNRGSILYALAVDGKVMTDYDIVIDIDKVTTAIGTGTANQLKVNDVDLKDNTDVSRAALSLELGENTIELTGDESAKIYDAYIEFEDEDQVDAYNITSSGLTINAPESAAGQIVNAIIHVLDVSGKDNKYYTTMTVKGTEVGEEEIAPQTFKFNSTLTESASPKIVIDLGNTFTALTSEQANKVNNHIEWKLDDNAKTIAGLNNILYFEKLDDANKEAKGQDTGKELDMATAATIKKAKYAVVPFTFKTATGDNAVAAGENKVTITLSDGTNEVKKVSTVLTFALPTFNELFPRTDQWSGDTYSTKLGADFSFNYAFAFNNAEGYDYNELTVAYTKVGNTTVTGSIGNDGSIELSGNVFNSETKKLITDKLSTKLTYKFKIGSTASNLKVESSFTTEIHSTFENPKLVYYVDGVAQDFATLGAGNVISSMTVSDTGVKNGLAIQYGRGEKEFAVNATVDGVKIVTSSAAANQVKADLSIKNSSATGNSLTDKGVTINENVTSGTLVVKFTDINGVVTEATINFK